MSARPSTRAETPPPVTDDEDFIDLRRYVAVIRKRKWIIAATCVLGVALTVLYTMRQTKVYAAEAKLVVDPQAPQVFGQAIQEVVQLGAGNYWSNQEYFNTQVEIIEGYDLARATVENRRLASTRALPYEDPRLIPAEEAAALSKDARIELATKILNSSIGGAIQADSRIVTITVRHSDPVLARDLANAHAETFKSHNLLVRREGSADAETFLSSARDQAGKELRAAEAKLLAFKNKNDLVSVSLEKQAEVVFDELARYSVALADARIKRLELTALRDRAKQAVGEDILDSPIFGLAGNLTAATLKDQYLRAKQQFTELAQDLGVKHPDYIAQKQKVDELHAEIAREANLAQREIEERYQAALGAETRFKAEADKKYNEAKALGDKQAEYDRIKREIESAHANYAKVRGRHDDSELSGANPVTNIRDHEKARTPTVHVFPRLRLNVALAFSLSLLLGIGLAFLLEYLDRTIKGLEDVESMAQVPVLGLIPVLAGVPETDEALRDRDLFVFKNPTSRAAECIRSIRTNILFSGADRRLDILAVSSPNPREGKTTSVMYLGTTMAQSGQRVLLIDTDMRRPRLHKSVGVPRGRGVSNLILGDAGYEDTIKTTEIPNLFVLPCGPTPPNPAELLLTNRFKEILDELRGRYDRIILDSPPLNAVTDAVVLSRLADGVIVVVQAGKTVRDDLVRARRQLDGVDANILGVIVNDLDLADRKYGYYNYAYGYGESTSETEPAT